MECFRYVNGEWQRNGNLAALPPDPAIVMTADAAGRLWFGYTKNRIALLDGDSVQMLGIDAGLNVGSVTAIGTRGEHTWIGGERGLMRFDGRRFVPVKLPGKTPIGLCGVWSKPRPASCGQQPDARSSGWIESSLQRYWPAAYPRRPPKFLTTGTGLLERSKACAPTRR